MIKSFYIIGFMGTGKSSLKQYLAKSNQVIDLDEYFEADVGMSIPVYFSTYGEEAFRRRESELLRQVQAEYVITGGGIVEQDGNIEWMKSRGVIIALDLPFEGCWERIRHSDRPLVKKGEANARALYERRKPLYEQAHVIIDASLEPLTIAQTIQRLKEEEK